MKFFSPNFNIVNLRSKVYLYLLAILQLLKCCIKETKKL